MVCGKLRPSFAKPSWGWLGLMFVAISATGQSPLKAEEAKWTVTGSLHTARIYHSATLLPNGRVLIVGGHGVSEDLASAELYEADEGVFVPTANLQTARANHTATLLPNGQVLVVGGQDNGTTLASAELYDPKTGAWRETGQLHLARAYHTATLLLNGQVLVAGGTHWASPPVYAQGAPPGSALDVAEVYDPATEKWTVTDSLHTARYAHTASLLQNGQVLVTGGLGLNGASDVVTSAELYHPRTKTWTKTDHLPLAVFNQTATVLRNGMVLVAGGKPTVDSDSADAELFRSPPQTWTTTGSLAVDRNGHSATLLPNGQVLVVGGANSSGVLSDVEMYQPSTKTWETTARLNTGRSLQTATLLPNGQVLVAGGGSALGSPSFVMDSAELYHVARPRPAEKPLEVLPPQPPQVPPLD